MPLITDSRAPASRQAPAPDVESRLPVASRPRASRQVRLLVALAVLAASVAAVPVNAPAQTDPAAPLDPAGCSDGTWVDNPENRPGLVEDCETLVAIRNHFASNPANADIIEGFWPRDNLWRPVPPREHYRLQRSESPDDRVTIFDFDLLEIRNENRIQLTGTIPAELADLPNLKQLDLSRNQLTGEIPAELGKLTNLQRLWLGPNQLIGPIPAELGNLTNLTNLGLAGNQLTGEIPAELVNLTNLQSLFLADNKLTGPIPAELANLTNLGYLNLSDNQLTSIPAELGNLPNLKQLYLKDNQLMDEIPAELANLPNLWELDLSGNQLTGPIPTELVKTTNIKLAAPLTLNLSDNQLTGTIPTELGNLIILDLSGNQLTGPIPAELGKKPNPTLSWLDLSDNQLTGPIPAELGNLTLSRLYLSGNQLTGPIPAELGNLRELDLSGNQLTGPIPASLRVSRSFKFCPNRLTGALPPQLRSVSVDFAGNPNDIASYCRLATVTTSFKGRFSDDEGSVHEDSIEQIAQWGITTGCSENRFCPSRIVTRAQMAAFLYRAVGASGPGGEVRLSDVAGDAWYRTNALWAVNNGVIRAPNGRFNPAVPVTRADMAEMLVAAFDHLTALAQARGVFADTGGWPDAAVRAMEGIRAAGVTTGCATNPLRYCPAQIVTRAQMASFLVRAVGR